MNAIRRADADASGNSHRRLSGADVQLQDGSLDAAFALLDDVRAQSFALQLRLRNSLSVRWADNALVMQRSSVKQSEWDATNTRARSATAPGSLSKRRQLPSNAHPVRREGTRLADESARADPIEEDLDWSCQRYRRRIEWDVAKRIARIDRELTSLPPDQRFWNKRRHREQQQWQIAPQKELSRARVRDATLKERDSKLQHGSPAKKPVNEMSNAGSNTSEVQYPSRTASYPTKVDPAKKALPNRERLTSPRGVSQPKPAERGVRRTSIDNGSEKRKPASYMATLPDRNKENLPPKVSRSKQHTPPKSVHSSNLPVSDSKTPIDLPNNCSNEQPPLSAEYEEKQPTALGGEGAHLQRQVAPAIETDSKVDKLAHEIILDLDEPSEDNTKVDDSILSSQGQHQERDQQHTKPEIATSGYLQYSSSVGRQVLSDFRNAPSMALYGPPAIADDRHNRKLNSDVLRRLFSDLDSDRDGHLNRIETCMALHRLQIAVPAPKIASFFRRVHAETNKPDPKDRGNSNRSAVHQPMKEVINYKQFIAFVTAANDRQSVQKQQGASRQQIRGAHGDNEAHPIGVPVAKQRTSNSIPPMQFSASISAPHQRENAIYELKDTNEDEEDGLEQSVLKSIPDYLITRLLTDERQSTRGDTKSKTASVVRKSLEKLLPRDSFDERMMQEIAQELIREHLLNRDPPLEATNNEEEDEGDLSGLRRAAAYFKKQPVSAIGVDSESIGEGREEIEDLDSWLDLLTEEQVSALVQEILKEKLPQSLQPDEVVDEADILPDEVPPTSTMIQNPDTVKSHTLEGSLETQGKSVDNKETDTQDFLSTHIRLAAEKEVQASECEAQFESVKLMVAPEPAEPDQKAPQSSPKAVSPALATRQLPKTRTNLAKAVLLASSANQFGEAAARKRAPATSLSILQKLRAERKRYHRVPAVSEFQAANEDSEREQLRPKVLEDQRSAKHVNTRAVDSSLEVERVGASSDSGVGHSGWTSDEAVVDPDQSTPSNDLPPIQLVEKKLCADDLSERSSFNMESRSSSNVSLSSFSDPRSSADSHRSLFSDFAVSARHSLQASTKRNWRSKWINLDNWMTSSYKSSLGSEDLSEGEIERRNSLDLSDGEIFGKARRRVAMQKNASNRFFSGRTAASDQLDSSNDDELNDTKSSIESGELLPITKLRSAYRERVLDSSFSSAESGELEDGLLS